jgi:integrase
MNKIIILPKQKDSNNECVVYIESISYVNGVRKRFRKNTGVKVNPANWSKSKSKVLSGDKLAEEKNEDINVFYEFINRPRNVSLSENRNTPKTLIDYIDDYIEYRKSLGTKRSSYKEFTTVKNRLERFQKSKKIILTFDDINLVFADAFKIWHSKENFDPNTIHKSFTILKTVLYHYFERQDDYGIKISTTFQNAKFGKIQTHLSPPLPLTPKEFRKLLDFDQLKKKYDFEDRTGILEKAKDAFLFGCATGLRYSDLFRVTKENIKDEIIYIEPVKTENTKKENQCKIPLNDYSSHILYKYNNSTASLKITNQYYNKILKVLFKALKFKDKVKIKEYNGLGEPVEVEYKKWEVLTSHNARDTFITFAIKVGIDIPSIMDMTGHTKYETMKKYIKLDDNHLITSMNKFSINKIDIVEETSYKKRVTAWKKIKSNKVIEIEPDSELDSIRVGGKKKKSE